MSAAIEIQGLTKDYATGFWRPKKKRALDSLSFEVQDGEVFGFLGPNGAGKTTTIKLLMGLIFPSAGTARIRGKSIEDVEMHRDIGFLPEQPYFYDYLTAREMLDYSARFFRIGRAKRREKVAEYLERVGLTGAADVQLRKFSKGMLQRVGIAQAILHDPPVVFLDEPSSGLDPLGRREVRDIILDLKKRGRTVFFSTHILPDAEVLCDRVAVLARGKLQGMGTPREIMSIEVQGMEIDFELGAGSAGATGGGSGAAGNLIAGATRVGSAYRLMVQEAEVYEALEELKRVGARIVAVTQIKPSMEDYFFKLAAKGDPVAKKISHSIDLPGDVSADDVSRRRGR